MSKNLEFKNKLLLLLIFLALLLTFKINSIFIYNSRKIFYNKKYELKQSIFLKSNIIKVENRTYYNKSFGFNYLDMCQKEYLLKFNRKAPDFNSNILFAVFIF